MTISEDGKTITLDVPIGGTVYAIHTSCNDACRFQAEKFREQFPDTHCSMDSPCHTKLHSIQKVTVGMVNLGVIIEGWRKRYFPTEDEASKFVEEMIERHKKMLIDAGLEVEFLV